MLQTWSLIITLAKNTILEPMPSNITDCKSAGNTTSVVVCADSSWETIHSDQIPPNVNYLLVANTNITTISQDSFSSKAIMILHMTYNPLERIESEGRVIYYQTKFI